MTELNTLINQKLNGKKYIYVSNEVEHSLGLIGQIDNLKILTLSNTDTVDYLKQDGVDVIQAENTSDLRSSSDILSEYVKSSPNLQNTIVQTFKISRPFETISKIHNLQLANTPSQLNTLFETKLTQAGLFGRAGINIPKHTIIELKNADHGSLKNEFGDNYVIQFNRGHTGSGTVFVDRAEILEKLKTQFPNRKVKVSEYIKGPTYSVNCCHSTTQGTYIAGIYRQITGIPALTANPGGTVGGSFNHDLDAEAQNRLQNEIKKLTLILDQYNYKGLYGLDFILTPQNEIKIIEMNARQQMTVGFNSRLNIIKGIPPVSLIHTAIFVDIQLPFSSHEYNQVSTKPQQASQLYLRNKSNSSIQIQNHLPTGEYNLKGEKIQKVSQNYLIDQISDQNIILLTQKKSNIIKPNSEIARIQIQKDIYPNATILPEYINLLTSVEQLVVKN